MSLCLVDIHGDIEGDYDIIHSFSRNATNGDIIKALFDVFCVPIMITVGNHDYMKNGYHVVNRDFYKDDFSLSVSEDWWNAPYLKEKINDE